MQSGRGYDRTTPREHGRSKSPRVAASIERERDRDKRETDRDKRENRRETATDRENSEKDRETEKTARQKETQKEAHRE